MTNFGYFNPLSILTNLLVLWTVPILMLVGGIAAFLSYVFAPLAELVVYLGYPLLWYFSLVINGVYNLSGVWKISDVPITMQIGYYCMVGGGVLLFKNYKKQISNES